MDINKTYLIRPLYAHNEDVGVLRKPACEECRTSVRPPSACFIYKRLEYIEDGGGACHRRFFSNIEDRVEVIRLIRGGVITQEQADLENLYAVL